MNEYRNFAKLIKYSQKNKWAGVVLGTVEVAPPDLQVRVNPKLLLKKHQICIAKEKVIGYTREFNIKGEIKEFTLENVTIETTSSNTEAGPGPHKHEHGTIEGTITGQAGTFEFDGTLKWTDELKVGEQVILIPTNQNSIFFLLDTSFYY